MNLIISLSIEQSGDAASHAAPPPSHSAQATTRDPAENPQENDIRKDFHGKSGRPSEFSTFEDYYEKTFKRTISPIHMSPLLPKLQTHHGNLLDPTPNSNLPRLRLRLPLTNGKLTNSSKLFSAVSKKMMILA
jgi:hypothetical protein